MKTALKDNPGAWLASLSSAERKEAAMSRGLFAYFPDALALVARHSVRANEKHNPGQPVHWAREKSTDHEDCILRHSAAIAVNPDALDDGQPEIVCRAWRALAALQIWAEAQVAKRETPAPKRADDPAAPWHQWRGEDAFGPRGVPPQDLVETLLRCGDVGTRPASGWLWKRGPYESDDDIVAWRPAK